MNIKLFQDSSTSQDVVDNCLAYVEGYTIIKLQQLIIQKEIISLKNLFSSLQVVVNKGVHSGFGLETWANPKPGPGFKPKSKLRLGRPWL